MDEDSIYKYYKPEELEDEDTKRMLDAKLELISKLKQFSEICKKATFEVIETSQPHIKSVHTKSTNTRTLTIRLANVKEPTFKKAQVKQDVEFDD